MSPAVVFLPDTALLVPGAAGRADPAAGLRSAAVVALRAAAPGPGGRVRVLAPGRRDRTLAHPVATGLGAAGLVDPGSPAAGTAVPATTATADAAPARTGSPAAGAAAAPTATVGVGAAVAPTASADVAASAALVLLRLAGIDAPVDVVETARTPTPPVADGSPNPTTSAVPLPGAALLVVVGSLSARHGPDAPLADDERAPQVDARLLAGLSSGPDALAAVLDDLGADTAEAIAVSGWRPWRAALAALRAGDDADVRLHPAACTDEVVAGAQHAVALWLPADPPRPAADRGAAVPVVVPSPEESR